MIALGIAIGALIAAALLFVRLFSGPTLYDRALAAHSMITKLTLVCAAAAMLWARAEWLDAAFALILTSVVLHLAILKVFRARTFQAPLARAGEDF